MSLIHLLTPTDYTFFFFFQLLLLLEAAFSDLSFSLQEIKMNEIGNTESLHLSQAQVQLESVRVGDPVFP